MAALVSHAMRRFPTSPPDAAYSYNLRSSDNGESALSRSMRYADPWLYGSVRAPGGLLLAPAFVLCACPDYINGTKRSSKKSPSTCKKCKGTRLPLSADATKYGTVRCYPTSTTATPLRAGTMRVVSSSRPSILPAADPYDLMRRSRLSVTESSSQFRARSISPSAKSKSSETRSLSASRVAPVVVAKQQRRSILECDINPYDLIESVSKDSSITLVNGQRIRVKSKEKMAVKKSPSPSPSPPPPMMSVKRVNSEKESECGRFKSILKKPSTTFSDTDSNGRERSPSPLPRSKSGSHFYLPMPGNTPRKKVQFLMVENEREQDDDQEYDIVEFSQESSKDNKDIDREDENNAIEDDREEDKIDEKPTATSTPTTTCKLRRSVSERFTNTPTNSKKVIFHDTMALRTRQPRTDSRNAFQSQDLERLDGLTPKTRRKSPTINKSRPNQPPPPPPQKELKEEEAKIVEATPPAAPPRKRSNNKQPALQIVQHNDVTTPTVADIDKNKDKAASSINNNNNKTVVQINASPTVHKLQIKNQFDDDVSNVAKISVIDNAQRKTSIMITGDDCYSTVNVNDDIPLYQSSVVVKDNNDSSSSAKTKSSSSVYITGNFVNSTDTKTNDNRACANKALDKFDQDNIPSSDLLKQLLQDPVEAVKRNLVPHVCGKSDVSRPPRDSTSQSSASLLIERLIESSAQQSSIEESFSRLRSYDSVNDDASSEPYELMDASSECYTDHSNRSSVTEEELANRTKFYEMLADAAAVELAEGDEHHYESIKMGQDPIYEEIEVPPPLPANPPPTSLMDDLHLDKEYTTRSIFEGASKYDILSYLVDAKERVKEATYNYPFPSNDDDLRTSVSDSSEDNSLIISNDKFQKSAEVERNDSGVGSETSKSSLSKYRLKPETSTSCEDCDTTIDLTSNDTEPLICRKCFKKRTERKEIIMEIVETEEKYSRDLQIILEEFYQPMLVAGLLTPEQLSAIFLNVEELLENSQSLAERLRDAVEIALEQGDEDLLTVNIGKIILEAAPMLHSFETYCVRQGAASLLLASLEKEKELLRIFLRVSQMENTMLRRMNLNSFLMVPVQRVTKYPLLLARLYKVTPAHHDTKEQLKEAQHKIELHLNHMNSETKDVPSKLWRRIGSSSGRRSSAEMDLVNIKLRKIAVDVLEWNHDEAKFALEGKLLFTQPTDNNWRKGRTIKLTPVNALLVINGKPSNSRPERPEDPSSLIFSRHSAAREAALLLVRDKNGRYSLLRDPLYLDRCVIAADPAWQSYFEVQELLGKDTFIFKAEDEEQTKVWYTQLQYHAQGMGAWRKRRNALANIMINGMGLRS